MTEHRKIARRVAEEDLRRLQSSARAIGTDIIYLNEPVPICGDGTGYTIGFAIGRRDDLSKAAANAAAHAWRELTRHYPKARVILHMLGYSDDPREIWEIPSARAYVGQWARLAGIVDFGATAAGSLRRESVGFLAACGVFGDDVQVKKPAPTPKN